MSESKPPVATGEIHDLRLRVRDPLLSLLRRLHVGNFWALAIMFFIYAPLEKLIIPALVHNLHLSGGFLGWTSDIWTPDIESLLTGFVEFPFFFGYYLWAEKGIRQMFLRLAPAFTDKQTFSAFAREADREMWKLLYPIVAAIFALGIVLIYQLEMWAPPYDTTNHVQPWFERSGTGYLDWSHPGQRVLSLILIGFIAYVGAQIIIREIMVVHWLRRMWKEMSDQLEIQIYHPDGSGGLGEIGRHAVRLCWVLGVFLLFILMGSLLPSLRDPSAELKFSWSPIIVSSICLYITLTIFLLVMLFQPAHEAMLQARDRHLFGLNQRLNKLTDQVIDEAALSNEQLASIAERRDKLRALRETVLKDFPSWPIGRARWVQLTTTWVGSIVLSPIANYLVTYWVKAFVREK